MALRVRDWSEPNHDAVCYHSQQCAEKYLKGVLQEREIAFPKTHDLLYLAELFEPSLEELAAIEAGLRVLTRMIADTRYPGFFATAPDSDEALSIVEQVRRLCREQIGLTND